MKQLWFYGIPPRLRGLLWELLLPNDLTITSELYQIFLAHAQRAKEAKTNTLGKEDTAELIELDLPRTFPALMFFQADGPCYRPLRDILEAYVCYRPDVGYVQGMSYIAGVLLLYMDAFPAFKVLANMLNRPCLLAFFRMDEHQVIYSFLE